MRVGRDPIVRADKRPEVGRRWTSSSRKQAYSSGASQEQPPSVPMALEASKFETRQAARRLGTLGPVDRRDPLESDVAELVAHVREAIRMPVEIDDIDLHPRRLRFA